MFIPFKVCHPVHRTPSENGVKDLQVMYIELCIVYRCFAIATHDMFMSAVTLRHSKCMCVKAFARIVFECLRLTAGDILLIPQKPIYQLHRYAR